MGLRRVCAVWTDGVRTDKRTVYFGTAEEGPRVGRGSQGRRPCLADAEATNLRGPCLRVQHDPQGPGPNVAVLIFRQKKITKSITPDSNAPLSVAIRARYEKFYFFSETVTRSRCKNAQRRPRFAVITECDILVVRHRA